MESQNKKDKIATIVLTAMFIVIVPFAITACAMDPEIEAANNLPMSVNSNQPMILKPIPEAKTSYESTS